LWIAWRLPAGLVRRLLALLLAGVHPKVAQERLGHHSVSFTLNRYSHTIERLHDDAAAKVDAIFRSPVEKL